MDFFKGFTRKVSGKRSKLRRICTETGKVEKLKKLQHLNPKYDVTKERFEGSTPLQLCAAKGFLDVATYLVEVVGVNIDEFSDAGTTALHTACNHDSLEVANYLIRKGADIKYIGGSKNTPPDVYAQARLRKSLSARGLNIPSDSDDEETKITDEKIETLSSLDSRHHQQIDQIDILGGEKPSSARKVTFTSDSHNVPIKDRLIDENEDSGCEECVTDQRGLLADDGNKMDSFLTTSAASPSTSVKIDNSVDEELRNIFCHSGSVTKLKAILEENPSIDVTNMKFEGITALQLCASSGFLGLAEYLVEECEVDVDEYSDAHFTALHVACNVGNQDIVEYLKSVGANVGAEDIDGKTPEEASGIIDVQYDLTQETYAADKSNNVTRSTTKPPIITHMRKDSGSNSSSESDLSRQSANPTSTLNSAVHALEKEEDESSHQMEHKVTQAEKEKRTRVEESNTLAADPSSNDFIPLNFIPIQFSCPTSPALSVYEKIMDLEQKSRPSTKPLSPRDTGRSSRRPSTIVSHFSPDTEDMLDHTAPIQGNNSDSAAESLIVRNLDANSFSATPSATKVRNTGVMNISGVRFEDEVEGESDDGLGCEENKQLKEDDRNEDTDPLPLDSVCKTSASTEKSVEGSARSIRMVPLSANPRRKRMTVVAARWDTIEVSSNNESDGMNSIMSGWTWSKTGLVEIKGPGERFSVEQAMASRPSSQAIGAAHAKLEPENIQRDLKEELDEEEKYEDEDGEDEEDSWNEDGSSLSIVEEEESTEGEKKEYESKSKEKMSN